MKTLLFIVALLAILAAVPVRAGSEPLLKAEVIGTVQTQILLSPADGRIHTSVLNNKRIFEEFGVSKTDYDLVFDIDGDILSLVPKHTSGGLPTITVVPSGSSGTEAVNTKTRVIAITAGLGTPTATNLFKNLDGELAGTIHYTGSIISSAVITKTSPTVLASGTDTTGNGGAGMKFKITAKGVFIPAP